MSSRLAIRGSSRSAQMHALIAALLVPCALAASIVEFGAIPNDSSDEVCPRCASVPVLRVLTHARRQASTTNAAAFVKAFEVSSLAATPLARGPAADGSSQSARTGQAANASASDRVVEVPAGQSFTSFGVEVSFLVTLRALLHEGACGVTSGPA